MYNAVRGFKTEEIVLLKKHPVRVYFKIKSLYLYPLGVISEQNRYNYTRKGCFDMNLGEYIRAKRKQHNLTQVELAERSGVGIRFVRELEKGKLTVQLDKVNQVLGLFGETLKPAKI